MTSLMESMGWIKVGGCGEGERGQSVRQIEDETNINVFTGLWNKKQEGKQPLEDSPWRMRMRKTFSNC